MIDNKVENYLFCIEYIIFNSELKKYNVFAKNKEIAIELLRHRMHVDLGKYVVQYLKIKQIYIIKTDDIVFEFV